ncbi:MAG: ATP-binding protein [Verrucomicrobiota bacterium]
MSQDFRRATTGDVNAELQRVIEEQLQAVLAERQPGHCMRVGDLDTAVMMEVARSLRLKVGQGAQVHVLSRDPRNNDALLITSSKLVELRNPSADGQLRPPLLVFVPNDLRTSAEDSFAEATFEQVSVADTFEQLRGRLTEQLPEALRSVVPEILCLVQERGWRWADALASVCFLLSMRLNGYEPDVVGAALCELGLVPDFHLLDDAATIPYRLTKNLECVDKLTFSNKSERGRVLDLKLGDRALRTQFGEFLAETGLEDPLVWTRRIVTEKQFWPLSFDKWQFEAGAGITQELRVEVTEIGLPVIQEDESNPRLKKLDLIGQQVLLVGQGGPKSFKVKFRCDPAPENVPGVHHFRLQVISREGGPTAFTKKKIVWSGSRRDGSVNFTGVAKVDWEDGWHFIRVLPCTADGDPIPIVDALGQPVPLIGGPDDLQLPNESDLFYVVKGDDIEVDVPQRSVPKFASFSHAQINFWFKALADGHDPKEVSCLHRAWVDAEDFKGKAELLEFKFAGEGLIHVPVSRVLKLLEQRILASPDETLSWRLAISSAQVADIFHDATSWPSLPEIEAFRASRQGLLAKISGPDGQQIVQSADLFPLRDEIATYAQLYLSILSQALRNAESAAPDEQPRALASLQTLLALDTAKIDLADHRGSHRAALLVSPTHPLRLLRVATWLTLANHWLEKAAQAPREFLTPTRDSLLERLNLVNFPAVFPAGSGQILTTIDNLHPLWTVYGASSDTDPRGLIAELCTALGLPEPNIGSFSLDGHFLAHRARRYLVQHPYIQMLVLNCFNAGRGRLLADMLLELQKESDFRELRYDLRLFVPDPDAPGCGEDLAELISPTSSLSAAEADAFATPSGNHLTPKLTFSVRDLAEFRANASDFSAHLSFLFDVFPAQSISAQPPRREDESAPVHGLLQDFSVTYVEDADVVAWHRRPRHGMAAPIPGAEEFPNLLTRLAETISTAAANISTGQAGLVLRPVSTLVLGADQKALLHQVHDVSDWVFTIDKSLGIEFFDHHPASRRPEYLIDHSPDLSGNSGRRVVITSRSHTEIRVLFERVLQDYDLSAYHNRAHALLGELRALSGRLALKLASSPTHRAEALGLALAKLYLEFQEAFRDQAVVPLDAHLDLFRALQKNSDELEDEITLRRTDLALFDFDASGPVPVLTCSLVEVKCYRAAGSLGGLSHLNQSIAEQIQQSERTLQYHFDPDRTGADRADRIIKTQELINLLEFYLDRAHRLNFLSPNAYEEAKFFLRTMQTGYKLRFTRSALVFDFDKDGSEDFVQENGIEFHRVGVNLIQKLLEALPAVASDQETRPFPAPEGANLQPTSETSTMQFLAKELPKLERAAFLREKRPRTVVWDKLTAPSDEFTKSETTAPERSPVYPLNPRMEAVPPPIAPVETVVEKPAELVVPPVVSAPPAQPVTTTAQPISPEQKHTIPEITMTPPTKPIHDVLLGVTGDSPQFGVLGKVMGRTVGLDLNQTHTISLFGVQGGGKSYTLGSIIEMASLSIPGINSLPQPLATVVFHYSQTQDYKPEFTSMIRPNDDPSAVAALAADYQARPAAMKDMVLLVPSGKLAARRAEYPGIEVLPLKFASAELQAGHWRFLMGAVGNQATYIRRLNQIMRSMRDGLTLAGLRAAIENAGLPDNLNELANVRLDLAADYIDDSVRISDLIRPGRLLIVDLRDEFIEKDEALGLFVVLLQLFGDAIFNGQSFNKLVVFDEAHKYIGNPDLVDGLISVVREMRHKGTSILVASQDPPSVPVSLIELSSQIILHRFNSPAWLKHIQKANAALLNLTPEQLARLQAGEAFIWSSKATDPTFFREAVKVKLRPRATSTAAQQKQRFKNRCVIASDERAKFWLGKLTKLNPKHVVQEAVVLLDTSTTRPVAPRRLCAEPGNRKRVWSHANGWWRHESPVGMGADAGGG